MEVEFPAANRIPETPPALSGIFYAMRRLFDRLWLFLLWVGLATAIVVIAAFGISPVTVGLLVLAAFTPVCVTVVVRPLAVFPFVEIAFLNVGRLAIGIISWIGLSVGFGAVSVAVSIAMRRHIGRVGADHSLALRPKRLDPAGKAFYRLRPARNSVTVSMIIRKANLDRVCELDRFQAGRVQFALMIEKTSSYATVSWHDIGANAVVIGTA